MSFSSLQTWLGVLIPIALSACLTPLAAKEPAASDGPAAPQPAAAASNPRAFERTSLELIDSLNLGWNLGNSLDVPDGETAWGNPPATAELLSAVAKAGFDLVRIPVTWSKHTGPGPGYVIDAKWLARVQQVVDYAHAAKLTAIINVHHDGADGFEGAEWLTLNDASGQTTQENNDKVRARFVRVWTQIAGHFANSGEDLIFESMNEIHDGYGDPDPRHFTFINELNQEFVNLVRESGGNNAKRHLVVPGYNTNIDHTVRGFKLPKDPTPNRLIVSAHFYDPYLFALQAKTNTWGKNSPKNDGWGQEEHVVAQFDKLKNAYTSQGVPVILGEYGATYQQGFEEYRRYYLEYVTKAAADRGFVPIYWDNGGKGSGGENFALFDRADGTVLHKDVVDALLRAARDSHKLADVAPPAVSP